MGSFKSWNYLSETPFRVSILNFPLRTSVSKYSRRLSSASMINFLLSQLDGQVAYLVVAQAGQFPKAGDILGSHGAFGVLLCDLATLRSCSTMISWRTTATACSRLKPGYIRLSKPLPLPCSYFSPLLAGRTCALRAFILLSLALKCSTATKSMLTTVTTLRLTNIAAE